MSLHASTLVHNTVHRLARLAAATMGVGMLLSCGGGSSPSTSTADPPLAAWALRPITDAALTAQFQSALSASNSAKVLADTSVISAPGSATTSAEASAAALAFSGTTLQETGVDEADLIKSDGTDVFSVVPGSSPRIERLRVQPGSSDAALKPVESLASPLLNNASPLGLYLDNERSQLVVLGQSGGIGDVYTRWFQPLSWISGTTEVAVVDTASAMKTRYTLGINAQLVNSRRINTTLYLVLRKRAQPTAFDAVWATNSKTSNEQQLEALNAADLLPRLTINGASTPTPLLAPDSCLAPVSSAGNASADIMTLVAIQLNTAEPSVAARCFVGTSEAVYLSPANLYLATTRWVYTPGPSPDALWYPPDMATDIHQFALDGLSMTYKGSGSVTGHLGFDQNRKSFRMGEHQGVLRVATQTAERWGPALAVGAGTAASATANASISSPVRLSLLKPTADKNLTLIGTLPNDRRPAAIGRSGEQLYASRFVGNRAYLVTYRLTDPLYVLDLSDPTDPHVAGELQVDGYSDYLFPLSERYLLGVGKDAKSDGSAGDGRFAWYQGVKVSLIDVGNPAHPIEAAHHIVGLRGTDASVLHDHHGIALLANNTLTQPNSVRVALPIRLHTAKPSYATGRLSDYYGFTRNQLSRFDIDLTTGALNMYDDLVGTDSGIERDLTQDRAWLSSGQVHHYQNGRWQSWRWD